MKKVIESPCNSIFSNIPNLMEQIIMINDIIKFSKTYSAQYFYFQLLLTWSKCALTGETNNSDKLPKLKNSLFRNLGAQNKPKRFSKQPT